MMIDGKFVDENCCNVFGCKDQIKKGIEEKDQIIADLRAKVKAFEDDLKEDDLLLKKDDLLLKKDDL